MGKKIYVGNLPYTATDDTLRGLFSEFGTIESAQVIMDRYSGRSKGFGFVEMASDAEAAEAISKLNGKDVEGRALTVNEARPMEKREGGRSGGGGGGGGQRGNRGGFGGGRKDRW
jgi:RNA recognition motif-containing protein